MTKQTQQLTLDFNESTTQRTKKAEKHRDQLTLFATWAPNIDISLHSPTEAIATIHGSNPEQATQWLKQLVGSLRPIKTKRLAFPTTQLHKLAYIRPPAKITLDATTQTIANAQHAHALGQKPLKITKQGRKLLATSPRGWPTGLRITDAPWAAIEALINTDTPLTITPEAQEAVAKKLQKTGNKLAKATLSGNTILITTNRPHILETQNLPALSYIGEPGDGTYRMPLLLGKTLLENELIETDTKTQQAIKNNTKPAKPLIINDETFPWSLWGFQQEDAGAGMRILQTTGGVLFAGSMGSGKSVSMLTNIYTSNGVTQIGKIKPGDQVFGRDGKLYNVLGVYPQGVRKLYKVSFSDKTYVLADAEHIWEVNTPSRKHLGNPGFTRTTQELMDAGLKEKSGNRKFYIPMPEPLQFPARHLRIPPYVMGALIGDGSIAQHNISLTDVTGEVAAFIKEDLLASRDPRMHMVEVKNGSTTPGVFYSWRLNGAQHGLRQEFDHYGLLGKHAWEKFIPEDYLYSSVEDRLLLLQGLLDTDGGCHSYGTQRRGNNGHVEFASTSEALLDAVIWLVQSLGGRAVKSAPRRTTYTYNGEKRTGRPSWRTSIALPAGISPFRMPTKANKYTPRTKYQPTRAIDSIEYWGEDEAVCIQVDSPDHLFVCESGIVTHNTTVSLGVAHEMDLWPLLVVLPLSAASTWARQFSEMGKSYYMATNSPKKDWEAMASADYDAYIVSFDRLGTFAELLRTKGLKAIIADELQRAKNAGSRRSRALRAMSSSVPYRIGLSGTPLVGGLSDLLAQFSFLVPSEFPPRASSKMLEDRYPGDPLESITQHIHATMVRRKISEVGRPLPPREDLRVYVELTPEQKAGLAGLEAEAQAAKEAGEFSGDNADAKMNALVKLQKMRQIIANPRAAGLQGPNPKLQAGLRVTKQFIAEGRQGVIFVADRQSYIDMSKMLDEAGIKWAGIWGSSTAQERIDAENDLHAGKVSVVLGTIQAAAESWSATPEGTFAVFCSYTYTATQLEQAEARVHRLNSDLNGPNIKIVYIHATDSSMEKSPDDRVVEILTAKKELAAKVIDQEEFSDQTLVANSLSDLLYMLTGETDEKLKAREEDEQRVAEAKRKAKEHAKNTIYKKKNKN